MDTLINNLTVEDVIMLSMLFFAVVVGFALGYIMGKG
jgi:hypothetical protein